MGTSAASVRDTRHRIRIDLPYTLLVLFTVSIATVTSIRGWSLVVEGRRDWHLLNWLIGYEAGFVRRGLSGIVVRPLAESLRLDPAVVVWAIQQIGYLTFFAGVLALAWRLRPIAWPVWPLLFAPFLLTFQVFDPMGGYRKDVLVLAGLALCAVATRQGDRAPWVVTAGAFAAVPVMLLHEGMVVYLPWLVALAGLGVWTRRQVALAASGILAAVATAGTAMLSSVTGPQVATICSQVADAARTSKDVACQSRSAVMLLGEDATFGLQWVAVVAPQSAPWIVPALLLVGAGMAPAVWLLPRPARRWVLGAGAIALTMSLPLFAVAVDWGRFLHVHAACGALVTLAWLGHDHHDPPTLKPSARLGFGLLTTVYALGWNVQHYGRLVGFGILD